MPVSYTVENGFALILGSGELTDKEILDTGRQFFADPKITSSMPILTDLSACTPSVVTKNMILGILAQRRSSPNRQGAAKHAICAPNDLAFGLSRVFSALSESDETEVEVRVFRQLEEAKAWLGIE